MLFFHARKDRAFIATASGLIALIGIAALWALSLHLPPKEDAEPPLSKEEKRVMKEIEKAGYCTQATDCEAVYAPCPFGCWAVVNKAESARIDALMKSSLATDDGTMCAYMCIAAEPVECIDHKCKMKPFPGLANPENAK